MRTQKLYLSPELTLDVLSETLQIPSKDLSLIFNRHFHSNFYEFINGYRIEEAKRLLIADDAKGDTILDIIYKFSSKQSLKFN